VCGDGDVHNAAAFVGQNHQDEQQAVRRGGDDEEIRGHHRASRRVEHESVVAPAREKPVAWNSAPSLIPFSIPCPKSR
jgi:hypothetical protein